jgi:uncharacterized membrane protein YphA (DoxX/SURF4 family)
MQLKYELFLQLNLNQDLLILMYVNSAIEIGIMICRVLVGLNFFFFGLNAFFNWIPLPPAEPKMDKWIQGLIQTGFVMPVIKVIEVLCGFLILINHYTLVAALVLAPIVLMIVLSHLFLNGKRGYGITVFTLIPYLILIISYVHQLSFFLS